MERGIFLLCTLGSGNRLSSLDWFCTVSDTFGGAGDSGGRGGG